MSERPKWADRFMSKVKTGSGTDCWLWTAHVNPLGYGRFGVGSVKDGSARMEFAHRLSYELHIGPVAKAEYVCHRCDNPSCVNPAHLFIGNNQVNVSDMAKKERGRKSQKGLPYGVGMDKRGRPRPFTAQGYKLGETHYLGAFETAEEAGAVAHAFKIAALRKELEG